MFELLTVLSTSSGVAMQIDVSGRVIMRKRCFDKASTVHGSKLNGFEAQGDYPSAWEVVNGEDEWPMETKVEEAETCLSTGRVRYRFLFGPEFYHARRANYPSVSGTSGGLVWRRNGLVEG